MASKLTSSAEISCRHKSLWSLLFKSILDSLNGVQPFRAVSCFAVDVIHKYACIALLIGIQTLAFGNHITDIFMVLFYAAFCQEEFGLQ